jgi:hypothetical protein
MSINTINTLIEDPESFLRQMRIGMTLGEIILPIPDINKIRNSNLFFNKPYWNFVKNNKDKIITGSLSLKAFGLIKREIGDIDLIVDTKNPDYSSLIENLKKSMKYPDGDSSKIGYIMSKKIYPWHKKYMVDFFRLDNPDFTEVDGFKFHNPIDILYIKMKLSGPRGKDKTDVIDSIKILMGF